jgi:hypothetical protein
VVLGLKETGSSFRPINEKKDLGFKLVWQINRKFYKPSGNLNQFLCNKFAHNSQDYS